MSHSVSLPRTTVGPLAVVLHFLHGSLLTLGVVVALLLAITLVTGEKLALPGNLSGGLPGGQAEETAATAAGAADNDAGLDHSMQTVADFLARRYRVAQPAIEDIVRTAEKSSRAVGFDPLLVLAMIGIESRFNPYSESAFGAQGLMQIIGRFHTDKFAPTPDGQALLDPETNIRVGVQILHEYQRRTGSLELALKRYGGESEESGFGYAARVQAERSRLEQVVARAPRQRT
jgi:soluble lytic murein transglycosylase-like protein